MVVAGTNGEGPLLSAVEKRDLVRLAVQARGKLDVVLGLATCSLPEAIWLSEQSAKAGAFAVMATAPYAFRPVTGEAAITWFRTLAEASPLPVIAYNLPRLTDAPFGEPLVRALAEIPNMMGVKDSSGSRENLSTFRTWLRDDQLLLQGDEALLLESLQAGWNGSISGCANVMPGWLSEVIRSGSAVKMDLIQPVVQALRSARPPATHKAILHAWGVLESPTVRMPLTTASPEEIEPLLNLMRDWLGLGSP